MSEKPSLAAITAKARVSRRRQSLARALLVSLLVSWCLLGAGPAGAQQSVRVGVYDFPPLAFVDANQKARGLLIDVLEEVARQENWTLDYVHGSFQESLARLQGGRIDLLVNITSSAERLKQFDFTKRHVYLDWSVVFRRARAPLETLPDLRGKRIGVLKGAAATAELRGLLEQFGVEASLIEKSEYGEIFRALGAGELDAGVGLNASALALEGRYGVERTAILFAPSPLRYAVKKESNPLLLKVLDARLEALAADRTSVYYSAPRKWLEPHTFWQDVPAWLRWVLASLVLGTMLVSGIALLLRTQIRRKTADLRTSEARFRSLTELSSDWYWEQDARFRFVRMDGNLELSTGITNEDHVGRTRWDLPALNLSAADWAAHKAMLEAHLPFQDFEIQRPDKGRRKHWVSVSGTPIFAADGSFTGYRGIGTDITQRKQAEQLLVTSKLEMQRVLNAAPAQIILCDANERYQFVNQAYADLMERPISGIIGRTLREVVGEDVYLLAKPHIRAVLAGNNLQYERTQQRADGSVRVLEVNYVPDIDADGTVCGWFGMHRDITEERNARTRIDESEERFRTLTEWSPEAILVHRNGTVIYANPAAVTLLCARSAEQIVGATFVDLIAPGYRPIAQQRIQTLLGGAMRTPVTEMQFLTFDAGIVDVEILGTYLAYDGEMAVHASLHDITLRKRAMATAASLEAQLRESQKMEAIGTLAGGIAHDFNNIIATILGNAALARTDAGANPEVQQSLEEIRKAGARARDLVQQILSFSRRQSTERKQMSLAPIIEESVRLLRATLPARVALEAHCAAGVPAVLADATQIEQVIINLATNAMQAMRGAPGRINLHLDALPLDDALADAHPALRPMHAQHPGRVVRLVVSDDGQGMEAAVRERIFEPFFTTKAVNEGTGLGLSVVHGIIQMHEGVITVESEVGKGSSFTLYLRAAEAEATAATATLVATTTAATPNAGTGRHILYLDDDAALVSLTQRLLGRRGYRISGFVNQEEALAALRADPAEFDLVLTDYNMPGMSGLDVARAVRAIRPDLPVAVASGFIDETLCAQAEGAGVRQLIFKATDFETFCTTVQALIESGRSIAATA